MDCFVLHFYHQQKMVYLYLDHKSKDELYIGKGSNSDIVLSSYGFRDKELCITKEGEHWYIEALADEANLIVNNEQLKKCKIESDQHITFVNIHKEELVIFVGDAKKYDRTYKRYELPVDSTVEIGNSASSHINILDKHVSKSHCLIYFDDEKNVHVIEDNQSQNGTYVNRSLIDKRDLQDGDEIFVAGYLMMFVRGQLHVSNVENGVTIQGLESVTSTYFEKKPRLNEPIPSRQIKVDDPPKIGDRPELNKLSVFLPPIAIIVVMTLASTMRGSYMMLMYSVPMSLISMIVAVANHRNNCLKHDEKVETLQHKYTEYLEKVCSEISEAQNAHRSMLTYDYPELEETLVMTKLKDKRLWNRIKGDDDFKQVRIGRARVQTRLELKVPEQKFELNDDEHKQRAIAIGRDYAFLDDMPHIIDLKACGRLGIVGERVSVKNHLRSILTNLATTHDYHLVKMMFFMSDSEFMEWRKIRWMPHVFSADRSKRYIATSNHEAEQLSGTINSILQERISRVSEASGTVEFKEHIVIVIDDKSLVRTEFYGDKENFYDKCGITFIYTGQGIEELPSECRDVLLLETRNSAVYYSQNKESVKYVPDKCSKKNFDEIIDNLAPVKVKGGSIEAAIPGNVPFLDVFDASSIGVLDIESRWKVSEGINSLRSPIGLVSGGRKLELDIHEKGHGPHGLLAGTSGSGKSELLQSLILSLGINYSADSVVFLIIDYKGGSTAKMFEGIPHLAGVITNLDGQKTQRALLSIKAEVKRRLTEFDKAGVNNVYDYEKLYKSGKVESSIPHLVLIVDEFAELKMEKPDFMKELVSVARVGRSLGIHLLLATQKPSGVVDEQIWSNSRFKICLKVLNAQDSQDILKKTDASKLVRPGRGYLQVGNNEIYELFQSGYTGATYIEGVKEEDPIYMMSLNGQLEKIELESDMNLKGSQNQLDAVIGYLRELGKRYKSKSLWLSDLEDVEYLTEEIASEMDNSAIELPLCKVDDPENLDQFTYTYNPEKMGHLAIYGQRATGKSHVLQNLVLSIASKYPPDDANIYIVDFAGKSLNMLGALPHVGGVLSDDEEILEKFIKFVSKEIRKRKELYAVSNASSLSMYNSMSGEKLPAMFLFIDNAAGMAELKVPFAPFIEALSREGVAYGVYLVLTANSSGSIKYKIANNIAEKISLSLVDKSEYSMTVGRSSLEPENIPGRCLVNNGNVLRAQMLTQIHGEIEAEKIDYLKNKIHELSIGVESSAKPVPVMPPKFNISDMLGRVGKVKPYEVVLGLDKEDIEKVSVDFEAVDHFVITGAPISGKSNTLSVVLEQLSAKMPSNLYLHRASLSDLSHSGKWNVIRNEEGISDCLSDLEALCESNKNARMDGDTVQHAFLVIEDVAEFNNLVNMDDMKRWEDLARQAKNLGVHIITSGDMGAFKGVYDGVVPVLKELGTGVLLGDVSNQQVFMVSGLPYNLSDMKVGEGFNVLRGRLERYQSPIHNALSGQEEEILCNLKSS